MKYFPLVWAGLWRRPLRTTLTALALVVAFVLFGLLQGINAGFTAIRDSARMDALAVQSRYQFPMPIAYKQQLLQMPNVKAVTAQANMGGQINGDPEKRITINFVDDGYFDYRAEINVTGAQIAELRRTRTGIVIGRVTAEDNGLKAGDRFTLKSQIARTDGATDWAFEVIAVADRTDVNDSARFVIGNLEYLNEDRSTNKNMMGQFLVVVSNPDEALATARRIDDTYLSSTAPTRTSVEKIRAELNYEDNTTPKMVNAIVLATLFALLLMTSNSMMQSFRERVPEFGTFKALGFTDGQVLTFVITEAVIQCLIGAVVGLGIARIAAPYTKELLAGPTGNMSVSAGVIGVGILVACAVALVSAAIPAWRALRLEIVHALSVR